MIGPPGPIDPHAIADGRLEALRRFALLAWTNRVMDDAIQQGVSPPFGFGFDVPISKMKWPP